VLFLFFGPKDIPGQNLWGDIFEDEELFAEKVVYHYGQPIGMIVAEDEWTARKAAKMVQVEYEDLPPILTIDEAIKQKSFYPQEYNLETEGVEQAFSSAAHIIEGEINMGGQEQFYFETQGSVAYVQDGEVTVVTSTQNANKTQKSVAQALGIPKNRVVCKVGRIGGGFGGKETRNINVSAACAVASWKLNRPIKMILHRDLDFQITGGRHPYKGKYKLAIDANGKIKAGNFALYSNAGFSFDLSGPVMLRAILFLDNCYKVPSIKIEGKLCKTNIWSNTAFRGFGGPQGTLVIEAAMEHAAEKLGVPVDKIRELNMYDHGDVTYYGQQVTKNIKRSWDVCREQSDYDKRQKAIQQFNAENKYRKRGMTLMPTKYGVAFGANFMNQGSTMILVYLDGSVLVTHGGVEMGQGLNTKVCQIVASALDIPLSSIHIQEMSTDKIANASPTAGSMGSDIYGMAALKAAQEIKQRLLPFIQKNPKGKFKDWVTAAYFDKVDLSARAFFTSEHEGYDLAKNRGKPWRYFTLGTSCTEVEVDTLTGDHKILRNDLVVDIGTPINPMIDIGQIEGAFTQGFGWSTIEELAWGDEQHQWIHPKGRLTTAGPGSYEIPSADDMPLDWRVTVLKADPQAQQLEIQAVHSSKAVGEPPLLLGLSVPLAIREAIKAYRQQEGLLGPLPWNSPMTSERIRMACVDRFTRLVIPEKKKADFFLAKGSF